MHFLQWKMLYLNSSFSEVCSHGPNWQYGRLVQIMAWPSHYLNQWWPSLMTHICVNQPQWVDIANWISIKIDTVLLHFLLDTEIRGQGCLTCLVSFYFYRLHDAVCCGLPALLCHGSCNSPWYCGAERWKNTSIGAHKNYEWCTERGGWDALR